MKREKLITFRKKSNLTQVQVADMVAINRSHYGFIENGERNPSYEVAHKISDVFGVTIEEAFPDEIFFGNRCYIKKQESA